MNGQIVSDRLKLAAFDLDGTLLDSIPQIVVGVQACWEALGFPTVEPREIRNIIGLPWEQGVEMLIPGGGAREVELIKAYHGEIARGERAAPQRPPEKVFEGALPLLDALEADGYLLAIVTSRSNRRLEDLLERAGLHGRFVSLKTADQGPGKPNPHLLLEAMKEAGVEAEDTVMVGDTIYDVQTARSARTGAIGVTWGVHDAGMLADAGAHHVVDVFEELAGRIDALIRNGAGR